MTPEQTAWLAGLLEGEGSFYKARSGGRNKRPWYPQLRLEMTDEDIVARVAGLLGCNYRQVAGKQRPDGEQYKETFVINLTGHPAVDVMQVIRPWLGTRRAAKVDELIAGYDGERRDARTHCRHGHEFTPENTYVDPTTGRRRCKSCHGRWDKTKSKAADRARRGFVASQRTCVVCSGPVPEDMHGLARYCGEDCKRAADAARHRRLYASRKEHA